MRKPRKVTEGELSVASTLDHADVHIRFGQHVLLFEYQLLSVCFKRNAGTLRGRVEAEMNISGRSRVRAQCPLTDRCCVQGC